LSPTHFSDSLGNGAKVTNKAFFVLNHVSDGAEAWLPGRKLASRSFLRPTDLPAGGEVGSESWEKVRYKEIVINAGCDLK
jgi:hypothetical protein